MVRAIVAVTLLAMTMGLVVGPTRAFAGPAGASGRLDARPACAATYSVVRGDSWFAISRRVGVSMTSLLGANAAETTTPLLVGATICLPAGASGSTTVVPTTAARATTTAPRVSTGTARPGCAATYSVVRGDSWFAISRRVGVSMTSLLGANAAETTTPLLVGATICLPQASAGGPTTTVPTNPTTTVPPPPTSAPLPVQLAAFPVQGPCWYADTWLAPRGGGRLHEGVDIIGRSGLYLYAVQDGTLTRQAVDRPGSLSGNAWWLTAKDGTYFFYAHLSAFAPGLRVGSKVKAGQVIGFVGRTGSASGNHLHFEVHPRGGRAVNPTAIVRAVDGCKVTAPLPQPEGVALPSPPATAPVTTVPDAGGTTPVTTTPPPNVPTAPPAPAVAPTSPRGPGLWQFGAPRSLGEVMIGALRPSSVRVGGVSGIPGSVTGAIVRLTATSQSAGYLTVYPCDTAPPAASTLSLRAGVTAVGSSIVEIAGGSVCLLSNVSARVRVETLALRSASGVGMQPVAASRVLDTRTTTKIGPGASARISPAALDASGASQAATVSVTIVNPASAGVLSMGFCGQGPWTVPVTADPVSSFAMTMRVSSAGWCLTSSVPMDVIVDVVGLWGGGRAVTTVDPVRAFDSRTTGGQVGSSARVVQVAGVGAVPGSSSSAVVSVTVVTGNLGSSVFVVPCGSPRSSGTVVAASPNRITSAVVPVALGGGTVCVSSIHPVDVIVDVVGAG